MVALDGAWHEQGGERSWHGLAHLQTSEVGVVLESTVRRIERHLRRRGLLGTDEDGTDPDAPGDPESPEVAQERLEPRPDGRITLKKAYTDGTVAVDMDPLCC